MSTFPALEVASPWRGGLPLGARVALTTSPFVIGRSREHPVSIQDGRVYKSHCQLTREAERWWLQDAGTQLGTWYLGRKSLTRVPLEQGDVFDVGGLVAFRLLLREPVEVSSAAMERSIFEAPAEDGRWLVYADWLLERGAALGTRMREPNPADDLRWLGPLALPVSSGGCDITWSHGVPARAVLHQRGRDLLQDRLATLVWLPIFRFVRALEVGHSTFDASPARASWAECVMELIGDKLPMLETLTIGPGARAPPSQRMADWLRARSQRNARFVTTPATLFAG